MFLINFIYPVKKIIPRVQWSRFVGIPNFHFDTIFPSVFININLVAQLPISNQDMVLKEKLRKIYNQN